MARQASKQKQRGSLPRAEVVLDLEITNERAELVLENCGDGAAMDVRVTFSRPLLAVGASLDLTRLPVFERLGVLRPGRSFRIFWDAASALFQGDEGAPFVATVEWSERARKRQRVEYRHDPAIYRQLPTCLDACPSVTVPR